MQLSKWPQTVWHTLQRLMLFAVYIFKSWFYLFYPLFLLHVPYVPLTAVIHPSSPHPYLAIALLLLCVPFLFLSLILAWWVSAPGDAELSEVALLWNKWQLLQLNIVHTPLSHRYQTHPHPTMMTPLLGYLNKRGLVHFCCFKANYNWYKLTLTICG